MQAEVILSWVSCRLQPLSDANSWRVWSGLLSAWMFVDIRTVLSLMADLEVKVIFLPQLKFWGGGKILNSEHKHTASQGEGRSKSSQVGACRWAYCLAQMFENYQYIRIFSFKCQHSTWHTLDHE